LARKYYGRSAAPQAQARLLKRRLKRRYAPFVFMRAQSKMLLHASDGKKTP